VTVTELVNRIINRTGTKWTAGQIREELNIQQNEILGVPNKISRVKPDPFFATTAATYSYAASSYLYDSSDGEQGDLVGDIREVRKIYSYDNSASIFDVYTLDPASDKPNQIIYRPTTDGVISVTDVIPSTNPNSADCTIKLWEGNNPGTTTEVWRAEAYKWPDQLTSPSITLTIPADFQTSLLYWAVIKEMDVDEYNAVGDPWQLYEKYKAQFYRKYGRTLSQAPQVCDQRDF
jgi:hypothetical protein